ncbi:MAG: CPBP family intramembrane metalloprotease [Dehalococcoidia bacterium]|nr:CPBP family intramembrane metalloprotease [Dehalococcoidia bacterium]
MLTCDSTLQMASIPMNSTDERLRMAVPWTLRDAAKAVALVAEVAALFVILAAFVSLVLGGAVPGSGFLLSAILEGTLLLAVWIFGPWRYGQSWNALGLRATVSSGVLLAALALLASFAFAVIYTAAMNVLGLAWLTPPLIPDELMGTYPERIAAFVLIVVVAPVAEESFLRGFLLPVFAGRWGFWVGASFVSVLFAIAHLAPGVLLPAIVSGLLLAWLYRRTGSLWNCCLTHGA